MKQKVLKGLKIVTRWLACAKSALVLGVIVALITWGMPLATPKFVAKVNGLLSAFDGNTDVVSLMFSSVISFVGIFISALLVYIQVYINRFPSELVLNQIKPRYANFGTAIALYLFFCVVEMVVKMGRFSDAVLSVCGVGIFIWLFYFAYSLHYKTSLTECTRTYVKDILNTESLLEDSKALKAKLKILEKTYNECVARNELYVCQIICEESNKIFLESMKANQKSIIDGTEKSKKIAESMNVIFVNSIELTRDAEMTANQKTQSVAVKNVVSQLILCIKLGLVDQYKKYCKQLKYELEILVKNQNKKLVNKYYTTLLEIVDVSHGLKTSNDYVKSLLKMLREEMVYFSSMSSQEATVGYLLVLTYCLEKDNNGDYLNELCAFLQGAIINMPGFEKDDQIIELIRNAFFTSINNLQESKDAVKLLKSVVLLAEKDDKWMKIYIQALVAMQQNTNAENFEKVFDMHVNLLEHAVNNCTGKENPIIPFPDFKRYALEIANNEDKENSLCRVISGLLVSSYNDNVKYIFVSLLDGLNECIELKIRKEFRDKLIKLYSVALCEISIANESELQETTLYFIEKSIEQLDRKNLISEQIGLELIGKIIDICTAIDSGIRSKQNISKMIFSWYNKFENPKNFVLTSKKIREKLIDGTYAVAMSALEENNTKLLKGTSNSIGWMLVQALQQDYSESKQLLNYAIDIYQKADAFGVAFNVRIYLLTLFTTIGAFCQTDSKYNSTGDAVISFLKEIPHDMIDLAIDVRKNDYDGWNNDEFGNIKNGVAILKGKLAT